MRKKDTQDNLPDLSGVTGEPFDTRQRSPLHLAYVGDAVHSLYVRTRLLSSSGGRSGRLHARSVEHLSAAGQALALKALTEGLDPEEMTVVRRGRNAKPASQPRNARAADYRCATAFEALLGYLYLSRSDSRLAEILARAFDAVDAPGEARDAVR